MDVSKYICSCRADLFAAHVRDKHPFSLLKYQFSHSPGSAPGVMGPAPHRSLLSNPLRETGSTASKCIESVRATCLMSQLACSEKPSGNPQICLGSFSPPNAPANIPARAELLRDIRSKERAPIMKSRFALRKQCYEGPFFSVTMESPNKPPRYFQSSFFLILFLSSAFILARFIFLSFIDTPFINIYIFI